MGGVSRKLAGHTRKWAWLAEVGQGKAEVALGGLRGRGLWGPQEWAGAGAEGAWPELQGVWPDQKHGSGRGWLKRV